MLQPPLQFFRALLLLLPALALPPSGLHAHPLQAEPINHPYVFTFDQFYLQEDPDEHLVEGGLLLMAELRCASCHEAPAAWRERLQPAPGPDLSGVGSRLDADTLWLMVRSPQLRKRGTQMPALFSNADGDAEKVEALVSYLQTLKRDVKPMPAGDATRGRQLFHTVGCIACHEPATDARPPGLPPEMDVEKPGNASHPIALADAYDLHSLGRFLIDPLQDRPSGRMPSMHLSEQEAADLAAYLHVGRAVEKAPERALLQVPPQTADFGREVFQAQRCNACHTTGQEVRPVIPALPLAQLQAATATNCIAESPAPGAARFGFNPLQLRALTLALKHVQTVALAPSTPQQRVDWTLTRLNCYACHDRDGKGGPEDPRAAYFLSAAADGDAMGDLAKFPPTLDHVGAKLTRSWLERTLWGRAGIVRPYLAVRMPNHGQANTLHLADDLVAVDKDTLPTVELSDAGPDAAAAGRRALGPEDLDCASCHGVAGQPATRLPWIDLTHSAARLQSGYFAALLQNPSDTHAGTPMPSMLKGRPLGAKKTAQIWSYLQSLAPEKKN